MVSDKYEKAYEDNSEPLPANRFGWGTPNPLDSRLEQSKPGDPLYRDEHGVVHINDDSFDLSLHPQQAPDSPSSSVAEAHPGGDEHYLAHRSLLEATHDATREKYNPPTKER